MTKSEALLHAATTLDNHAMVGKVRRAQLTDDYVLVTVDRGLGLSAWVKVRFLGPRAHVQTQILLSAVDAPIGVLKADLVALEQYLYQALAVDVKVATRELFLSRFQTHTEALAFETYILGAKDLPECVVVVLNGQDPTPEYWDFLISQTITHADAQMFLLKH